MFEELTEDEVLMLDWAVYNEITRYIRQDLSNLTSRQRFKYDNLQSLRQKIMSWAENGAKIRNLT